MVPEPATRFRDSEHGVRWRRILLVGFMGSGKSTVGAEVARALDWPFLDLDVEVERWAGETIPEIFRRQGEEAFRRLEDRVARGLLDEDGLILASGGGWPCRPGRLESVDESTLSIWLRVPVEQSLDRVGGQGVERPLLAVEDPLGRVRELMSEREPYYRLARWWVDTANRTSTQVAEVIVNRLRTDPERPLRE